MPMKTKWFCFLLVLSLCLSWTGFVLADTAKPSLNSESTGQMVYWYERGVKKQTWMALDELAVVAEKELQAASLEILRGLLHPQADILETNKKVALLKSPEPTDQKQILQKTQSIRSLGKVSRVSPVFYNDASKNASSRRILTGEIIVRFQADMDDGDIKLLEKQHAMTRVKQASFAGNTFVYKFADPLVSLETANKLVESGLVDYALPNWGKTLSKRAIPDDVLFENQWHLNNTGQSGGTAGEDVNIAAVWSTYTGSTNEIIGIVDDGLDINHEDLHENVLAGMSWDYVEGDDDPSQTGYYDGHGTNVAGVAAGRGFNGIGISGSAPHAGLVGHRLLGSMFTLDLDEAEALTRNNDIIDIYSNSWGPVDWSYWNQVTYLDGPGPQTEDALASGAANGRGGLGSIFVWAGGNGYDQDNSNYDGYANSRYTIAVAASTNTGMRASYSEKGANILINSPSGGGTLYITTTDCDDPSGYTSWFNGTSAATPLVSGIIALMLQANPDLTWRDVQHILIETAAKNDPGDADWAVNGAGYPINHKYGFGRIDARAAVSAAETWVTATPELSTQGSASPNLAIPDNDTTGITSSITISREFAVEFVEIYFTAADHTYWGDLEIILTSPDGTQSVLAEAHSISQNGTTYNNWRFGSVRHYGETSSGTWTLQVKDLQPVDTGTLQSWTIKLFGNDGVVEVAAPAAATGTTQLISPNSVFLKGSVLPNGLETTYYFEYGLTDAYGSTTVTGSAGSGATQSSIQTYLTDLSPDTTYHYRIVASNNLGTSYGDDKTFVTDDTSDLEAFVTRFYNLCLNREPDEAGLNSWVNSLLDGSMTGADVAMGIVLSDEFVGRGVRNTDFLTILYRAFFDREPDEVGLVLWQAELDNGMDRTEVLNGFINSPEFKELCQCFGISSEPVSAFVKRFYQLCLNRNPDAAGLDAWVAGLTNGSSTGAYVAQGFVFSPEFINRRTSDAEFLTILYRAFFNREPDDVGYSAWLAELEADAEREDILEGFIYAPEFVNLCGNFSITAY